MPLHFALQTRRCCVTRLQVNKVTSAAAKPVKLNWESSSSPADAVNLCNVPVSTKRSTMAPLAISSASSVLALRPPPLSPHNIRALSSPTLNTTPRSPHPYSPPITSRTAQQVAICVSTNPTGNSNDHTSKSRETLQPLCPALQRAQKHNIIDASEPDMGQRPATAAVHAAPTSAPSSHVGAGAAAMRPRTAGAVQRKQDKAMVAVQRKQDKAMVAVQRKQDRAMVAVQRKKDKAMVAVQLQQANACVDLPQLPESVQKQQKQQQQQQQQTPQRPLQQQQQQQQQQNESTSPFSSSCMPVWLYMSHTLPPSPPSPLPAPLFPNKSLRKLQVRTFSPQALSILA
jgi:hypothetical protein